MTPDDYLRRRPQSNGVLYYPGSGTDWGPLNLFGIHEQIATAIYVDYTITNAAARQFLTTIPGWLDVAAMPEDVQPDYLGVDSWDRCWSDEPDARRFAHPDRAFGLLSRVASQTAKLEVIFLATEAIQTYSLLLRRGLGASVVVLQDHGFGLNWSSFGGDSVLYRVNHQQLPDLLLVGENTVPWPEYHQVSDYAVIEGQQHDHPRALFAREGRHADR